MTWSRSSFTEHYRKIRIEGFQLDKLIDKCLKKQIDLRTVRFIDDLTVTLTISNADYKRLKKIAKNTYRITTLGWGGYRHTGGTIWRHKVTVIGVILFIALLYWQSLFIAEVKVDGYEKIGERQIRQCMEKSGLYEGCDKDVDINKVKLDLYDRFDEISWVGVEFTGRLVDVKIVEGAMPVKKKVKKTKPCDIIADKAGYISKVIPLTGMRAVKDNAYVKKGDVLISGTVPLNNVAYGTEGENETETYVHAEGTVKAKIPKRLVFYSERYERVKKKTGRVLWGISINGHNTAKAMNQYEVSVLTEKKLFSIIKPWPVELSIVKLEEAKLEAKKASKVAVKRAVNAEIRKYTKEKLPEKAQILNKSLNFTMKKNIIEIGVTLETLQNIGIEKEIIVGKPKDGHGKPEKNPPG